MTLAGISTARTFSALRHPNYRLFWWGALVSLTGSWMRIAAQSWLVYDLTGSPFMLGTVTMINTLPTMLLGLLGGAVADRSEKRYLLIGTQGVFMVAAAAMAVLTLTGRIEVWHILALSAVSGIAAALDMPARQSLIPHLVEREDLMNAIALNSAAFNGSRIVGPVLAGLIIDQLGGRAGPGWSFAINAVTYLGVIGALAMIPVISRPAVAGSQNVLLDVREGVTYAWSQPALRTLLGLLTVAGVFGLSFMVLMPVVARDVLNVPARGFGFLMTASGVGATIGVLAVASSRPARPWTAIMGTFTAFVVSLAAFAASTVYALSLALMVVVSGTITAYLSLSNTTIQLVVPDELRGRVMSLYILAFFGTAPLGGLIIGALASALGAQVALLICAAVCGVAAVLVRSAGRTVSPQPSLAA
jgi:MFS family permease